jgi:hypothetical protein
MASGKVILACSLLVVIQVFVALGFVTTRASAQSEQLVTVLIAENSREACEVQSRRSSDGNWGAQTIIGPPTACEGGVVSARITTQEGALQEVTRAELTAESEEVTVVPLTGNAAMDEETVLAEMTAIHERFASGVAAEGEDPLGFMSPDALEALPLDRKLPGTTVLAAKCKSGSVSQWRRRDTRFRSLGTQAVVVAHVHYKRISCARWRITDVKMTLIQPPNHDRVWFRNFHYTKAWLGDRYGLGEAGKQCWELRLNEWSVFQPGWTMKAGGSAKIEGIDANPNTPGTVPSCWSGAGASFVSFWTFLPGGTR